MVAIAVLVVVLAVILGYYALIPLALDKIVASASSGDASEANAIIVDGNKTLILENSTFNLDLRYIIVKDNGTLIIRNAEIRSNLVDRVPLISVYDNGNVLISNSKLKQRVYIRLFGDNVTAEIRDSVVEGSIGFGWGGGKLNVINTEFFYLCVWGSGATIVVENSTSLYPGSYITGNSSLLIKNSLFKSFSMQFGSTLAHLVQ